MLKITLAAAALAVATFAANPVRAEDTLTNGQTPPTPNSGSSTAQPMNSLPAGAGTDTLERPGSNLGTTTVTPPLAPVSRYSMTALNIHRDPFHGEWNCTIKPRNQKMIRPFYDGSA